MSRTIPTVPSSTHNVRPMSPTTSTASGRTLGPIRTSSNICRVNPFGSGNRSTTSGSIRATSAFAWASVAPGFSLASPW